MRLLGWSILAVGGGAIVWALARLRFRIDGVVGFAIAVVGAALGAVAGRYLETAEWIDHHLEGFGNIEVDDVSTWVPTILGAASLLAVYIGVRYRFARRRAHDGAAIRAQDTTTKDGST